MRFQIKNSLVRIDYNKENYCSLSIKLILINILFMPEVDSNIF